MTQSQLKMLPRVDPFPMPAKEDCYFYHSFDFPDGEVVVGDWDIRGVFNQYIANYPLVGKTVLDVGAATGFLSLNAEKEGAVVTSLEVRSLAEINRLPFVCNSNHVNRQSWYAEHSSFHDKLKNGYWYAWHKLNSQASVSYTPIQELPYYDEQFDVVVAGAIIEHLSDPVSSIGCISRLAKEAVIIAFTPVELSDEQFMRTMNPWSDANTDETWWLLSEGLYRKIFANLGFEIELVPAKAYFTGAGNHHEAYRYSIVARRVVPLGGQPLALPERKPVKSDRGLWKKISSFSPFSRP